MLSAPTKLMFYGAITLELQNTQDTYRIFTKDNVHIYVNSISSEIEMSLDSS